MIHFDGALVATAVLDMARSAFTDARMKLGPPDGQQLLVRGVARHAGFRAGSAGGDMTGLAPIFQKRVNLGQRPRYRHILPKGKGGRSLSADDHDHGGHQNDRHCGGAPISDRRDLHGHHLRPR